MKLDKRVGLLVLPVLAFGYFIAFLGVYDVQKKQLVQLEAVSAELRVSELAEHLTHYKVVAEQLASQVGSHKDILGLINSRDRDLWIRREADHAIAAIAGQHSEGLTVALYDEVGNLLYIYDQSDEFTVASAPQYRNWLSSLAVSGNSFGLSSEAEGMARVASVQLFDAGGPQLPAMSGASNEVALVVAVDAPSYQQVLADLTSDGLTVDWVRDHGVGESVAGEALYIDQWVPFFGRLRVAIPWVGVEHQFKAIIGMLGLAFLVLAALSYLALRFLIWRYITRPINHLQKELATANCESKEQLLVHASNDEIGSLSRAFANLYGDLRKSYQIAREMAEKDGLTALYNRRMFNYYIDRILHKAQQSGGKVALLYIDVDNFKRINDKYGHTVGDELLRNFADQLSKVLRPGDLLASPVSQNCTARLAGDEFAVILYDFDDDDVPRRVAMRILGVCDSGYLVDSVRVPASLSIGVACFPRDASSAAELISSADTAMYQAKHKGKNQYSFYSQELAAKARRVADVEAAIGALQYSELTLEYMPIVAAPDRSVIGVEALLRWRSGSLGWVSPDEFIPIAEATGAFREIDRWVINQVSADLPRLMGHFGSELMAAVNISAAELESREFLDEITAMVQQGFICPDNLELEITETFHVNHHAEGELILGKLRDLGFSISIDDFGTGFTSLVQLVEYPIDKIKLDKHFLDKVMARDRLAVIRSLVEFCKSQGFGITAEGVETADQVVAYTDAGFDYLQGFYFARPMPLTQLIEQYPGGETVVQQIGDRPSLALASA